MKKSHTAQTLDRKTLLQTARSHLDMVKQWRDLESWDFTAEYYHKATAVIELLEVADCGSTGGFDVGQEPKGMDLTLEKRYKWLKDKK